MTNKNVIANIQRQISIYDFVNITFNSTVVVNTIFTYKGLEFRVHTQFNRPANFNTILGYIEPLSHDCMIINKGGHGLSQFAPVYFNGSTFYDAQSNSYDKLATHVLLEVNTDWALLVSSGVYNYPSHGLTVSMLFCSSTVSGTNSTIYDTYKNYTYNVINESYFEVIVNYPAEFTGVQVLKEGYYLAGFYQGDSASAQSWSLPVDGDVTTKLKIIAFIDGYSTGGSTASALSINMKFNNDGGTNYRYQQQYCSTADFTTVTSGQNGSVNPTSIPLVSTTGYQGMTEFVSDLKTTGSYRLNNLMTNYRLNTTWYNLRRCGLWVNTANKITTLDFTTLVYTKYRIWVYLAE